MRTVRPVTAIVVGLAMAVSACSPGTGASEDASAAAEAAALEAAASEDAAAEAAALEAAASEEAAALEASASEAAAVLEAAASESARVAEEAASEAEAARVAAEEEAARIAAEEEAARIAAEEEAARIAAEEEAARIAAEEEAARIAAEEKKEAEGFQTILKELGYYEGKIDGDVGNQTVAAIKAFQEVNDLKVDGEVGPQTTEALASDDALPKPPPEPAPKKKSGGSDTADLPEGELSVADAQRVLIDMNYYGGAADGNATDSFRTALVAFQKVEGIAADGVLGPTTSAHLRSPRTPSLRGGESNRIEIDLSAQVIHVVKGGVRIRTMPTSSGNGESYGTSSGGTATALTPVGDYRIERRIVGVREADLGILYDPLYFYRGWAIHGSNSVPSYPASHGCTRVSRTDIVWLAGQMSNGTQVRIYGGTHVFTP